MKLYPYKMGSESGKELARLLDVKRVRPDGNYVPKIGHTVINWGNGKAPAWLETARRRDVTLLNSPEAVKTASNKLKGLVALEEAGIAVPQFTTDRRIAKYWLDDGHTVVERHVLNGNSADGVRIVNLDDPDMSSELESAPLYTKFIPKSREFRVHVFRGEVVDYAEKKKVRQERRPDNFNKYICSNEMGWVFCRLNIKHIDPVKELGIKAVEALGLDFGAVDVVYHEGTPYVLEVNTAPGVMGTTLKRYVNTFRGFVGLPDLPMEVSADETVTVVEGETSSEAPFSAADSALDTETVTLELDLATARKLKTLLGELVS